MHEHYDNPLIHRYASVAMSRLWSDAERIATWRRLWLILAETQRELGLAIDAEQIEELRGNLEPIDWQAAEAYERSLRHDVMAHVHTWGDACPRARPIIHLGATSCYVTDNTDLILIRRGAELLAQRLAAAIAALADCAVRWADLACLGFTHFQPAQPTTMGKRACLWIHDLVTDLEQLESFAAGLRARGAKGTTGTQASFLRLFDGDPARVVQLDQRIAERMGFSGTYPVTGQTYSRKVDARLLDLLSGIAQSAHKAAVDWRLLAHRKELEEPFESKQVGSSAMAYKRNPMRSERLCGLARFVFSLQTSAVQTAAQQWLERTLDDSANRRLVLPQAFLATDAILILLHNIASGLIVYPQVIARNLAAELPFMASENILMAAVAAGGDRQQLHEALRAHSQSAARQVKEFGNDNDLLQRLKGDPLFASVDFAAETDPRAFIGRAPEQVREFLASVVAPIRQRFDGRPAPNSELRV